MVGPLPSGEYSVRDVAGSFGLYPKAPGPFPELHAARYCAALNRNERVDVFGAVGWSNGEYSHTLTVPPSWAEPVSLGFRVTPETHKEVTRQTKAP